jgi:hypothetical protein
MNLMVIKRVLFGVALILFLYLIEKQFLEMPRKLSFNYGIFFLVFFAVLGILGIILLNQILFEYSKGYATLVSEYSSSKRFYRERKKENFIFWFVLSANILICLILLSCAAVVLAAFI